MDKIIRAISSDGFIKMSAVSTKGITERARIIHKSLPVVTAALGRLMAATSMMGNMLKEDKGSVTIRVNGGGPVGSLITVSDSMGNVRGYVQNPNVDIPKRPDGKLNVGGAVGRDGMITVTKDIGMRENYVGSAQLISGEIAEDVAAYYVESEQVGAACGLGVLIDTYQSVLASGGYIVELMPGASEELLEKLEKNIKDMGAVTQWLRGEEPVNLINGVLKGFEPRILEQDTVEYRCYCSRERVVEALISTGEDSLKEMATSGEITEVSCQFCDKVEKFTPDEIQELMKKESEKIKKSY